MPSIDDVYRKFGETSEAAQLLETELGTLLIEIGATEKGLLSGSNPALAAELVNKINKNTLGATLKQLGPAFDTPDKLENLFSEALTERNRLTHSFFRQHNFRRNSEEGRAAMLDDLDSIHEIVWNAYKAALALSGIDLDAVMAGGISFTKSHVKI